MIYKKAGNSNSSLLFYYCFLVLRPSAIQIGQKLIRLVATSTAARIRITPGVPEITCVK
jgi:hypothetical protein